MEYGEARLIFKAIRKKYLEAIISTKKPQLPQETEKFKANA